MGDFNFMVTEYILHPMKPGLNSEQLNDRLKRAGLKITPARLQILELLEKKHCLLTIDEMFQLLKNKIDWATIYRTVVSFEEKGLVTSSTLGDGSTRYECSGNHDAHDHDHHHHHHVMCVKCKKIEPVGFEIETCGIEALEKMIQKMGFSDIQHRLEFSGVCRNCKKTNKKS